VASAAGPAISGKRTKKNARASSAKKMLAATSPFLIAPPHVGGPGAARPVEAALRYFVTRRLETDGAELLIDIALGNQRLEG